MIYVYAEEFANIRYRYKDCITKVLNDSHFDAGGHKVVHSTFTTFLFLKKILNVIWTRHTSQHFATFLFLKYIVNWVQGSAQFVILSWRKKGLPYSDKPLYERLKVWTRRMSTDFKYLYRDMLVCCVPVLGVVITEKRLNNTRTKRLYTSILWIHKDTY